MKKTALLLALIIFSFMFSQNIEGLGIFKLTKFNTNQIDSLASVLNISIENCDTYDCEFKTNSKVGIKRLKPNLIETYKSPTGASYSENISVYSLNNYNLNNRYENEKITLSFYKSILYKIEIARPDTKLMDDLEIKYGKGVIKKKESSDNCRLNGKSFEFPSVIYTREWNNIEKDFNMTYMLIDGHSSNCDERIISGLYLIDNKSFRIAIDESNDAKSKFQTTVNQRKKENLKDL